MARADRFCDCAICKASRGGDGGVPPALLDGAPDPLRVFVQLVV
jgi:hypothetical protein